MKRAAQKPKRRHSVTETVHAILMEHFSVGGKVAMDSMHRKAPHLGRNQVSAALSNLASVWGELERAGFRGRFRVYRIVRLTPHLDFHNPPKEGRTVNRVGGARVPRPRPQEPQEPSIEDRLSTITDALVELAAQLEEIRGELKDQSS